MDIAMLGDFGNVMMILHSTTFVVSDYDLHQKPICLPTSLSKQFHNHNTELSVVIEPCIRIKFGYLHGFCY